MISPINAMPPNMKIVVIIGALALELMCDNCAARIPKQIEALATYNAATA